MPRLRQWSRVRGNTMNPTRPTEDTKSLPLILGGSTTFFFFYFFLLSCSTFAFTFLFISFPWVSGLAMNPCFKGRSIQKTKRRKEDFQRISRNNKNKNNKNKNKYVKNVSWQRSSPAKACLSPTPFKERRKWGLQGTGKGVFMARIVCLLAVLPKACLRNRRFTRCKSGKNEWVLSKRRHNGWVLHELTSHFMGGLGWQRACGNLVALLFSLHTLALSYLLLLTFFLSS